MRRLWLSNFGDSRNDRTPLPVWFRAMWWVTSQKNGVSALGLQRVLGLKSYETAWAWLHKLRRAMVRAGRDRLTVQSRGTGRHRWRDQRLRYGYNGRRIGYRRGFRASRLHSSHILPADPLSRREYAFRYRTFGGALSSPRSGSHFPDP